MSAVKMFALGVLVTGISAAPTLGGSMSSSDRSPDGRTRAHATAPTRLIYAPSIPSPTVVTAAPQSMPATFAAANLARSSNDPTNTSNGGIPFGNAGDPTGSITLGVNGTGPIGGSQPIGTSGGPGYSQPASRMSVSGPAPVSASAQPADAFLNFGSGPYLESGSLTTGNARPFYQSTAFTHLFPNGGPTAQDVKNFQAEVLATVQKTYSDANLSINLTTDPNARTAHTMSIVSGASYSANPDAIGITDVGNNGFSFIDKFGQASSPYELATAIGHNLAHELMHAFGISNHPEQTGSLVDAATTSWSALADPSTEFSSAAATLLSTLDFQKVGASVVAGAQQIDGAQVLVPTAISPVPEPSTVALWASAGGCFLAYRRRKAA